MRDRLWTAALLPLAALLATLACRGGTALAMWTGPVSGSFGLGTYEQVEHYSGSTFTGDSCGWISGYNVTGGQWESGNRLTQLDIDLGMAAPLSIPAGATVIGGRLSGSYSRVDGADSAQAALGALAALPSTQNCRGSFGTGSGVPVSGAGGSFSVDGYALAAGLAAGQTVIYAQGGLPQPVPGGTGQDHVAFGTISVAAEYAFTPAGLVAAAAPDGAQAKLSWSAAGNDGSVPYVVQRAPAGTSAWSTLAEGATTAFTTSDQPSCGSGYLYRVAAGGPDATTPWATAAEWDQHPCAVTVAPADPQTLDISFPPVAGDPNYELVWCASAACTPQGWDLGAATSARLTGLTPNTAYTVWACTTTDQVDCPTAAAWTYAAVPAALAWTTSGETVWNARVQWSAAGNPAGTAYVLERQIWNGAGLVQDWTPLGGGLTAASLITTDQACGVTYDYAVHAVNGAGVATAADQGGGPFQNAPCDETLTADGTTALDVAWSPTAPPGTPGTGYTLIWQAAAGGPYTYLAEGGATSAQLSRLQPGGGYRVWLAGSSGWWNEGGLAFTAPAAPVAVGLGGIGQTVLTASWSSGGNPAGTQYEAVLEAAPDGGPWLQDSGWITATQWTLTGLHPGTDYEVWVEAGSGSGQTSAWVLVGEGVTVPAAPSGFSAATGGLGFSAVAGRGYVVLDWSPAAGASGYDVWMWDGAAYEAFDVGAATSWDSRQARVFPADAALYPNVGVGALPPPVLDHGGAGLDLRDQPRDLYCSTGAQYCSVLPSENYWFGISAYNASGNSASFAPGGYACSQPTACQTPTLPLQTDAAAPEVTAWTINGGGAYTYSGSVSFSLGAADAVSGVAAYALSNDGSVWALTDVAGCVAGQATPCGATLAATGSWALAPGPGGKTVWAKVESAAGLWSAPSSADVYVNVDQTQPTVDATLNSGAASTASTSVSVGVTVSDPGASPGEATTWQARYSTDGGANWSAWQDEGTATAWSTPWALPGGAAGERTVLVQVENADQNLGQAGASIYYAPPDTAGASALPAGGGRPCTWAVDGVAVQATCVVSPQVAVPLDLPSGAVRMRSSLDNVTWGPWDPVAPSVDLDLGSAPGAKSVWVQAQDALGAVTAQAPLYYVYDPGAPTVQASWAGGASATDGAGAATLLVQAADDAGTVGLQLQVSANGTQVYAGPCLDSVPLTLAGAGFQTVQITVVNAAGTPTTTALGIYVA